MKASETKTDGQAQPVLVLASSSPRRRELLAAYGYRAIVAPANIEESAATWLTVRELVLLNARRKANCLRDTYPDAVVLGVDTLVSLDGQALGKPADQAAAVAMLTRLSGRTHQVYSGVHLTQRLPARTASLVVTTDVHFKELSHAAIARYLQLIDPLDKAGGYAAQEHGDQIIKSIEGSATNVMGLPMESLAQVLKDVFSMRPAGRVNLAACPKIA